ncbi:hypothetical protein HaLaN_17488, partial [Haematococcus lacustris]
SRVYRCLTSGASPGKRVLVFEAMPAQAITDTSELLYDQIVASSVVPLIITNPTPVAHSLQTTGDHWAPHQN